MCTRPRGCAPGRRPGSLVVEEKDDDEEDKKVPTKEGPGQPVVDGAKDPSVRVEGQKQGGDPRGHAEILGRSFQASSIFVLFCFEKNSAVNSNLRRWH